MKLIVLGLFVLFIGQVGVGQPSLTKEEYGIYSLALRDWVRGHRRDNKEDSAKRFLILSRTGSDTEDSAEPSKSSVYQSFDERNKQKADIKPKFAVNFDYSVASESEILELIEKGRLKFEAEQERARTENKPLALPFCGPGWGEAFYQRFPAAQFYLKLSRIGFSRDHRSAYLKVKVTGEDSDQRHNYFLRWTAAGWKIVKSFGVHSVC
ncbi:MAG: hypothetical protein ACJ72Z_11290 [Pyrinomonadaceae bacterium]